jgi:hypothetical protein
VELTVRVDEAVTREIEDDDDLGDDFELEANEASPGSLASQQQQAEEEVDPDAVEMDAEYVAEYVAQVMAETPEMDIGRVHPTTGEPLIQLPTELFLKVERARPQVCAMPYHTVFLLISADLTEKERLVA